MFKSLRARKNSVWNIFFYLFLQEPALSKVEGQTVLREIPKKVSAWDIILSELYKFHIIISASDIFQTKLWLDIRQRPNSLWIAHLKSAQ